MSKLTVEQQEKLPRFFQWAENRAASLANDAGYSGSWGDGGAAHLREMVECWRAGMDGRIPDALKREFKEFEKLNNPRYAEYLRLKEEFGDDL